MPKRKLIVGSSPISSPPVILPQPATTSPSVQSASLILTKMMNAQNHSATQISSSQSLQIAPRLTHSSSTSSQPTPSILHSKRSSSSQPDDFSSISYNDSSDAFSQFKFIGTAATAASMAAYDGPSHKRRKQDPKTGKGLRHFSMKVGSDMLTLCFAHNNINIAVFQFLLILNLDLSHS